MSDLIERLRRKPCDIALSIEERMVMKLLNGLMDEAADKIESLEADAKGYREQIQRLEQEEKEAYSLGFKHGAQEKRDLNKHGFQEYHCTQCDTEWTGAIDSTCPTCEGVE